METIETIIQWHKETFPDITFEEQKQKLALENKEYFNSITIIDEVMAEELADVYIATIGLMRFGLIRPLLEVPELIRKVYNQLLCSDKKVEGSYLERKINEKMAINRKRKWHKVNGEMIGKIVKGE